MNNREYMDEENAEKVYRVFNQVFKTGLPRKSFDWKITQKDGSRKILEASVSCIKDSEDCSPRIQEESSGTLPPVKKLKKSY